ncbi:MAG: hypothetical protein R3275_03630 [Saprospiraceae bacterium]|nr:hypothetical protein [Saprospiraceae bacterium]
MTDQLEYRAFVDSQEEWPFFMTPWWMDAMCGKEHWSACMVMEKDECLAAMPFEYRKKYGLTKISTPEFTPHSGPWILRPQSEKPHSIMASFEGVVQRLLKSLPPYSRLDLKLSPETPYSLPFTWAALQESSRYTYRLPVISAESTFENFNRTIRKHLQSEDDWIVSVEEMDDILDFLYEHNKHYDKSQLSKLRLLDTIPDSKVEGIKLGVRKDGKLTAVQLAIMDKDTVFLLASGVDKSVEHNRSFNNIIWHLVEKYTESINTIDFMGSMDPAVASTYRALSAIPSRYSQLSQKRMGLF